MLCEVSDLRQFCNMSNFSVAKACFIAVVFQFFSHYSSFGQKVATAKGSYARPKLVVGLVIDQMRYDYLYKYQARYGQGGFKRLLAGGFNCHNTFLNYVPTVTGCGHASIYTGSVPALNGIASNEWFDKNIGKMMYCAQDDSVKGVGTSLKSGKMSPKNLLSTTIGDEIKLATNNRGKVVGIALKDRGAILPAGGSADAAYWMEDTLGDFVSSTWYMNELPAWVADFNAKAKARNYITKDWNTLYPISTYSNSTADDNKYEGKFKNEDAPIFPHKTSAFTKAADIKKTPFGNSITLDFALEAIKNMQLGMDAEPDLLAISLSSTDYVGHQFGINSIEIEDTYYRLDRDIDAFLKQLDALVGANNYVLFLSADHGAAHNPTFLRDEQIAGGYFFPAAAKKSINEKAIAKFGKPVIADIGDNQIWLNDSVAASEALPFVLEEIKKEKNMTAAGLFSELENAVMPALIKERFSNGYRMNRSGDIYFILNPGFQDAYGSGTKGTTHGTWNPHDAHIPFLLYGWGIKHGDLYRNVNVTDIAPTINTLLRIQMPNASIGECVGEALK